MWPGASPEWIERQSVGDILAYIVAIGEEKGGSYDLESRTWTRPIPPPTTFAVWATMPE